MEKDQVIEITQEEALKIVESIEWVEDKIHCFMGFLGADWDKERVVELIKDSKRIAWADNPFNHNLAVINNGRLHSFDIKYEDYISNLTTK